MKNLFENIEEIQNSNLKLSFNKKINLKERFFLNFLINFYQLPLQLLFHFLPLLFPATVENCRNMFISAVNRSDLKCIRTVL